MSIKKSSGFTIVELLIVIVVIGILAAITIVAYKGVQDRAARTQTVGALNSYIKALRLYGTDNGSYPDFTNACLGGPDISNGRCYQISDNAASCSGSGKAYSKSGFDDAIKSYLGGSFPKLSSQSYNCGGGQYTGGLYYASNPKAALLFAFMKASVGSCPSIGGVSVTNTNTQDESIICRYSLPVLP